MRTCETPAPLYPRAALCMLLLLAACASYGPPKLAAGTSIDEARAALGVPTGAYPLPGGGRRFEFARGPYGKHTWMLDYDAQGRLLEWSQVLSVAHFNEILPGMSADEVLARIGRPSERGLLPFQHRDLWSYRYEGPFCLWFQLGIDAQGHVVDGGYGPDPACDDARPDSPL